MHTYINMHRYTMHYVLSDTPESIFV